MKLLGIKVRTIPNSTLLDIGCGQGWQVIQAREQGANAFGIDVSKELLSAAMGNWRSRMDGQNFVFLSGITDRLPFPENHFDMVICNEVIEHVPRVAETIEEMSRVLKPGGILFITIPTRYVERTIAFFNRRFLSYSGHIRQFSIREMRSDLERQKFRLVSQHRLNMEWSFYWLVRAIANRIPEVDRSGSNYGIDLSSSRLNKLDYYYKRFWVKVSQRKVFAPLIWFGNLLFPKTILFVCEKA